MKKIYFAATLLIVVLFFVLSGCWNKQMLDTTYKFDRAIIHLSDGTVVDGKVESWLDFDDSDAIQVKVDGVTYYVALENAALIAE